MAEFQKPREINVDDVLKYLGRAFAKAASKAASKIGAKAVRERNADGVWETTKMYTYQVEFAYMIDNIKRGPSYIAPKYIQKANELIDELESIGN